MDIVIVARLLIPIFTLIIGTVCQYLIFFEAGISAWQMLSKAIFLWIIYFLMGLLASEHFLRFMKRRSNK